MQTRAIDYTGIDYQIYQLIIIEKQKTISTLTIKAEYIALGNAIEKKIYKSDERYEIRKTDDHSRYDDR